MLFTTAKSFEGFGVIARSSRRCRGVLRVLVRQRQQRRGDPDGGRGDSLAKAMRRCKDFSSLTATGESDAEDAVQR